MPEYEITVSRTESKVIKVTAEDLESAVDSFENDGRMVSLSTGPWIIASAQEVHPL